MVQEVVRGIFYFLIASGLITWLIRQIFLNYFNKDIEKFKSEIKQEQIRFSRLHEKRAEVIEELYITLADFDTKINSLISPVQWAGEHPKQKKKELAAEAGNKFTDLCLKNRIYFNEK